MGAAFRTRTGIRKRPAYRPPIEGGVEGEWLAEACEEDDPTPTPRRRVLQRRGGAKCLQDVLRRRRAIMMFENISHRWCATGESSIGGVGSIRRAIASDLGELARQEARRPRGDAPILVGRVPPISEVPLAVVVEVDGAHGGAGVLVRVPIDEDCAPRHRRREVRRQRRRGGIERHRRRNPTRRLTLKELLIKSIRSHNMLTMRFPYT